MHSSTSHGQLPNAQNVSTSNTNSSENCQICHQPPTINNIVKCNNCRLPFHRQCARITNSNCWKCIDCVINVLPGSPLSVCSQNSRASNSSRTSNSRRQLQLQRLEEERQLERDFLKKKYQILEQAQDDDEDLGSVTDSVNQWLNNQPEPNLHSYVPMSSLNNNRSNPGIQRTVTETNLFTLSNQTDSSIPIAPNSQNITSNFVYTNETQPNSTNTAFNNNNFVQDQNVLLTQNQTSHNLLNFATNNPFTNQETNNSQTDKHLQNPYAHPSFFTPPSFTNNPIANSTQRNLTHHQFNARQTVPKELPIFSGNPEDWPLFNSTYKWSTTTCGLTDAENLVRLQKALRGDALRSVQHILIHPSCVPEAVSTLKLLYGQPEKIVNSVKNKIKLLPAVNTKKLETITSFAVEVKGLKTIIEACELYDELNNSSLLQDLINKMPSNLQLEWGKHKMKLTKEKIKANLSEFAAWLYDVGVSASIVNLESCSGASTSTEIVSRNKQKNEYMHTHSEQNRRSCIVCQKNCSNVSNCETFLTADRNERWNIVRRYNLCKLCLRKHYGVCKSNIVCGKENCQIKHNSLLHASLNTEENVKRDEQISNENRNNSNQAHNVNTHSGSFNQILFKIVPIKIFGKNKKCVKTFAFIDEGSSVSLMDEKIYHDLNLEGEPEPLCLKWTSNVERNEKESMKISISMCGPNKKTHFLEVRTVKQLLLPSQSINYNDLSKQFPYLRGLPIENYKDAVPSVLIGLNNINLCVTNRIKEGRVGEPTAVCTRLGWFLCGNMSGKINHDQYSCIHICECNDTKLNNLVKQFYTIETSGIAGKSKVLGREEQRALSILEEQTTQKPNGHYETALLWRLDNIELPESYQMAKKRLICLERILKNNNDLFNVFEKTISEYLNKNYITKLENAENGSNKVWYLPIFPVFNKNKPNKTRIVWDAASKSHGVSLNSMLLKGPDLLSSLPAILFRFRQKKVAVTADIEQMFHRIFIKEDDRHCQRFLWRSCDTTKDPEIYIMNVMIFGASCAPCISQYVKNLNAAKYEEKYPQASAAIINNHYVDDFLISTDTSEEALKMAKEVHYIHSLARFNLRNWCSNSKIVLEKMNADKSDVKNLNIGDELETEKILGIFWKPSDDVITFKISPSILNSQIFIGERIPTKREVLKILMSVYDPLGLVGNFLMFLKITLQEIWRSGVGWDDTILGPQAEKWKKWLSFLPKLKDVNLPRCYLKSLSNYNNTFVELHTFVDASENGYAAVSYLRISCGENIIISLVGSKTRVAPLKLASIPRLELMGALIGARYSKTIIDSHEININRKIFWSDSRTVLSWIRSDHRKYQQFVAVRVSEILDLSEIEEWRWIAGKLNVADDATKWSNTPNITQSSRWFCGPEFLKLSEDMWPVEEKDTKFTDVEIKHQNLVIQCVKPFIIFERFSRWCRLLRAVGYVIKFCDFVKQKQKKSDFKNELTQDELRTAEILLLKEAQYEVFSDEIKALLQGKIISKSSSIYKQSPFMDSQGVLRVGGRIENADVPEEMKNPAILPKHSYVTELLILHYHHKFHHINHETAINELRQRYHVARLRVVFKSVVKRCQMCKVKKAVPILPQMANLPRARLAAYVAPFSFTGLDYFGPLFVTVSRHKEKRYGALFTCLTVRAVHIEIVNSLNTSSCIMAIRNFTARRGIPIEFFSDNGTNFVGAERELRQALQEVDVNELVRSFTTSTTKWNFNTPAAPHMGGAWERLVRSVKSVLYKISPERCPNEEILRSMMAEVENIVNSRPLTYVPIEDENMEALTPNHFLLGSSNGLKPLASYDDSEVVLRQCWLSSQQFAERFWKRWVAEYLPTLTCRTKWFERAKPLEVGDLVLVVDPGNPRNVWPRGKIIEVFKADDGQVRKAKVMTKCGVLERPTAKLAILDVSQK